MALASADSTSTKMSLSQEPQGEGAEEISELETHKLKEAEEFWDVDPPPFIDNGIPDSIQPDGQLEVWKASPLGQQPPINGSKTLITCRAWKNTNLKYWTCDGITEDWRYIVGGLGVPNSRGWFVWLVWHGNETGFTAKRVLFTRLDTQNFTPKVQPLEDGKGPGEMDQNQGMREAYDTLEAAEKGRGTSDQFLSSACMSPIFLLPSERQAVLKALSSVSPMACLRHRFFTLIRGIDQPALRPVREATKRQRRATSPSSQLMASLSTRDSGLQIPRTKRLKNRARPDIESVQSVEGAAVEDEGETFSSLTRNETGASSSRQVTAINPENTNSSQQPVAPVTNIVAPGASRPLSMAERKKLEVKSPAHHHLHASKVEFPTKDSLLAG